MKRFLVLLSFLLLVFLSFIPVLNYGAAELRANAPILLDSVKLPEGYCILPGPSHSSEAMFENNSFEFVPKSLDVFSDINGFRPYPWVEKYSLEVCLLYALRIVIWEDDLL